MSKEYYQMGWTLDDTYTMIIFVREIINVTLLKKILLR